MRLLLTLTTITLFCNCKALAKFRAKMRSKGLSRETFEIHRLWHPFKESLTCNKGEGESYHNIECANGACEICGDLQKWQTCEATESEGAAIDDEDLISYDEYETIEVLDSKGQKKTTKDFVRKTGVHPFDFITKLKEFYKQKFRMHHYTAVIQDAAWNSAQKSIKDRKGKGFVLIVMDFAEKYTHLGLQEHQQKYYNQKSSTLFMVHAYVHLEDMKLEDQEKDRLRKLFQKYDQDPIIHVSLPVISDDPEQDVAFVLHTLEKIIFEWIKDNVEKNSGSEITDYDVHIFTDGCKAQFKNSTYFWYISQIGPKKGFKTTANFFCSCHGKCSCDPDGGTIKFLARSYEMGKTETTSGVDLKLKDSQEFYEYCNETMSTVKNKGLENDGKGLYRRYFHFIPRKGPGCINRRAIRRAETLIGSSKMHRFAPTSYAGYIHVCQHSCPKYCVDCVDMNYGKCQWKSYSGEIRKAQVDVKGGNIQFKNSREYYEDRGLEIAGKLGVGDFVGWEDDLSEAFPYHILQVTKEPYSVGSAKLRSVTPWDDEERTFERGTSVFKCRRLRCDYADGEFYYCDPQEDEITLGSKGIRLPMSVTIVSASNASLKYFIKDEELQILKHVAGVFEDVVEFTPVLT
jgi:hypothetical protein